MASLKISLPLTSPPFPFIKHHIPLSLMIITNRSELHFQNTRKAVFFLMLESSIKEEKEGKKSKSDNYYWFHCSGLYSKGRWNNWTRDWDIREGTSPSEVMLMFLLKHGNLEGPVQLHDFLNLWLEITRNFMSKQEKNALKKHSKFKHQNCTASFWGRQKFMNTLHSIVNFFFNSKAIR